MSEAVFEHFLPSVSQLEARLLESRLLESRGSWLLYKQSVQKPENNRVATTNHLLHLPRSSLHFHLDGQSVEADKCAVSIQTPFSHV